VRVSAYSATCVGRTSRNSGKNSEETQENSMYDMYPASWRVVDDSARRAHRHRRTDREADREATQARAVQAGMNRRDNGGEPTQ